jgi:cytochrome c biogenesis protein CcmG, thiol:disulfide interchange protein DsbE
LQILLRRAPFVNSARLACVGLKELTSLLLCVALVVSLTNSLSAKAEPRLGDPAPELIIILPSGQPFDLSTMKGRVVLVNFWATWCEPCLAEMPIIEKFYRKHHAHGFDVIAFSTNSPRLRELVGTVLAGLSFPGALLNDANYNGFGFLAPLSYVIDANGIIRGKFGADIDEQQLNETVLPLLKEASVRPRARVGWQDAGLSGGATATMGSRTKDASTPHPRVATLHGRRRRTRERYASYKNDLRSAAFFFGLF